MGPEILIVGDRSHRGALIPRVQDLGYTVTPVRERELSGRVGASPAPAAVLICLGETDAAALVAAARRGRDDVPVVIFGSLDLADVLELGADHFLAAPVGDAELARVLAELAGPGAPDDDPGLWRPGEDEDDPVRPLTGPTSGSGLGQLQRTLEILAARVQSHAGESEPDALELDSLGLDAVPDVDRELDPPDGEALLTDHESSDPAAPRRREATQRIAQPRLSAPRPTPPPEDSRGAMQGEDTMRLRAPTRTVGATSARAPVREDRSVGRPGVREDRRAGGRAVPEDRSGGERAGGREDRSIGARSGGRDDRSGSERSGAVREDRSAERSGAVREDRSAERSGAVREDRSAERRLRSGPGDTTARVLARRPDEARGARGAGETTRPTTPRGEGRAAQESGDSTARLTAPRSEGRAAQESGDSTARLTAPRSDGRAAQESGDSTARLTAPRGDGRAAQESGDSTARLTAPRIDTRETADEPARPGAPRSGPGESRRRETLSEARGDARRAAVWSDEARVGPARGEGREGPVRGEGREGPVRGEGREGPVRGEGREGPVHGEGRQGPTRTGASRDEDRSGRAAGSDRGRERSLGSHDGPPGRPRDELRDARQAGRAGRDADATDPGDPQAARDGDETTSRSRSSTSTPRAAFDLPRPDATESIVRRPRVEGERLTGAEVLERLWQLHARRVHGRLTVGFAGGAIKRVWWRRGEPVHATSTAAADGLLARLQARGLLARAQLGVAAREIDEQLGESARRLVQAGLLKPREQHEAVRDVIARIVESLCSDAAERWQFDAEAPPTEVSLGVPVLALLAAGARLGLGRDRLRAQLPEDVALRLEVDDVAALAAELRWPEADAWLGLLDGSRSLALLVAEDGLDERELWAAGCVLLAAGLAVRAEPAADAALLAIDRRRVDERLALAQSSDYFTLLGVGRDAGRAEVIRAHEDLRGTFADERLEPRSREVLADALAELHAALDEAREVLLDEALRAAYLAHLDSMLPPGE